MKNIILEGTRGTGKSTLGRFLRERVNNNTLINFTGFDDGGHTGLQKSINYYNHWSMFFHGMKNMPESYTFIHDRYFFSEMVYSKLYKDYDFSPHYFNLVRDIERFMDEVHIVYLYASEEVLRERLNREKIQLFGRVEESVSESIKQQSMYDDLFTQLYNMKIPNVKLHPIQVDDWTEQEIGDHVYALTK